MPTYILRPDGTITAGWSLGGTATSTHQAVNGTAVQPTAGEVGAYIFINGNGNVAEVSLGTVSLGTETVTGLTVWEYGAADGLAGSHTFQAYTGTTALGAAGTTPDSAANAWRSTTYSGSLTQAQVDDLRIRFTNGPGGLGSNYVREAYIELTTAAGSTVVTAGTASATADGDPVVVRAGVTVAADTASATADGDPVAVRAGVTVPADTASATADGDPVAFAAGVVVAAGTAAATASGDPVVVSAGVTIPADTASATASADPVALAAGVTVAAGPAVAISSGSPVVVSNGATAARKTVLYVFDD